MGVTGGEKEQLTTFETSSSSPAKRQLSRLLQQECDSSSSAGSSRTNSPSSSSKVKGIFHTLKNCHGNLDHIIQIGLYWHFNAWWFGVLLWCYPMAISSNQYLHSVDGI